MTSRNLSGVGAVSSPLRSIVPGRPAGPAGWKELLWELPTTQGLPLQVQNCSKESWWGRELAEFLFLGLAASPTAPWELSPAPTPPHPTQPNLHFNKSPGDLVALQC